MHNSRFSDAQIARTLKQLNQGRKIATICRELEVSEATVHAWRAQFRGIDTRAVSAHSLILENRRLKQLVGVLTYERDTLKGILRSNGLPTSAE
jgi:putative transposase